MGVVELFVVKLCVPCCHCTSRSKLRRRFRVAILEDRSRPCRIRVVFSLSLSPHGSGADLIWTFGFQNESPVVTVFRLPRFPLRTGELRRSEGRKIETVSIEAGLPIFDGTEKNPRTNNCAKYCDRRSIKMEQPLHFVDHRNLNLVLRLSMN